jgi:anti-anti-sigma factor
MLEIHARNLGEITVLCLEGQIVNGETKILRDGVESLSETRAVILDLGRVRTVDAHGLGVLLELRQWCESKGIRFGLMNVTGLVRRVLEISRLDAVFQVSSGIEFFPAVSREQRAFVARLRSCA